MAKRDLISDRLKIYVIGTEDTVIGFGLIGISGTIIKDPIAAKELLLKLTHPKKYDLIIINNSLLRELQDFVQNYRLNHDNPILFDIPDETGEPVQNTLQLFLKRAFMV